MFGLSKIEKIKKDHPLEDTIRSYGVELKQQGQSLIGRCPFHDDDTPSLSISPSKQLWNCFGCSAGGDVISFVEQIENISNKEAIVRFSHNFEPQKQFKITEKKHETPRSSQQIEQPSASIDSDHIFKEVCRVYHETFSESVTAQNYLINRGLKNPGNWKHFQVGYCDGKRLKNILPDSGNMIEQLKKLGILNDKGNECFYKCVVFPIHDQNGIPVGLYGRSIEGKRHLYLKGKHQSVWNINAVKAFDQLILTESLIDAFSLFELGFQNVLPLYGTQGLTDNHLELFESNAVKEIILCMDNDAAGENAIDSITEKLKPLKTPVSRISLPTEFKDPNDFLIAGQDSDAFEKLLKARERLNPIIENIEEKHKKAEGLVQNGHDYAVFHFGELVFQARGFRSKYGDSMRVVLSVTSADGKRFIDRTDLYVARNRRNYANMCANTLKLQSALIESHLSEVIEGIESLQQNQNNEKEKKVSGPETMSASEKELALKFLKTPALMKAIKKDLDHCGYIGEDAAKMIAYLSATSRITDNPISMTIRASSATGKSHLMEKVSQLMPPEDVSFYSRISSQSLYYMEKDALKNRLLIIDEKAGANDQSDYALRTLISRKSLSLAVVVHNTETGDSKTQTIEIEGPCVVWDSTTQQNVNPENLSRVFEIWLGSDSRKQTKRIHEMQRYRYKEEGWREEQNASEIIQTHQNAQRLLKPLRVKIPFVDQIKFPDHWTRTRRDNERFLSLISSIALLHQYQRPIKETAGVKFIEATKDDYQAAYDLAVDVLRATFQPLSKGAHDLFAFLLREVSKKAEQAQVAINDYMFTRREIRDSIGWSESKLRMYLDELANMEYLFRLAGRHGSSFRYRLLETHELSDPLKGLTTPAEIA